MNEISLQLSLRGRLFHKRCYSLTKNNPKIKKLKITEEQSIHPNELDELDEGPTEQPIVHDEELCSHIEIGPNQLDELEVPGIIK
jgi:hypothetical protein